ncbi:hypothetical protein DFH28DRAFT_928240 [Melampsora americana]|nr:hypothetical protein DFH28DRAFT_928240 [Melampsora americana]
MYRQNCGGEFCLSAKGNFQGPLPHISPSQRQCAAAHHLAFACQALKAHAQFTELKHWDPFVGNTNADTINLEYKDMSNGRYRNKSGLATHSACGEGPRRQGPFNCLQKSRKNAHNSFQANVKG